MNFELIHNKLTKFILSSIADAKREFDALESIGIYVSPINGWLSINVNSQANLELASFNCPEFDNIEFRLFELSGIELETEKEYSEFYNGEETLCWNGEDEQLNEFVFNYIISQILPSILVKYQKPLLLQMLDSEYVQIWNVTAQVREVFETLNASNN